MLVAAALPVLATVFSAWQVSAIEDCLWYEDKNGTWHDGFDCPLISFCCGACHRRYCCLNVIEMISERQQRRCMLFQFSPTTIAGIASSILLFVATMATVVCCFMCSCCYLYQRRLRRRPSCQAQQIPMDPMYNAYAKPIGPHPSYPMAPQYRPGMPQGPYHPYPPVDPGYGQGALPPHYLGI